MKTILILGAGTAGTAIAHKLRRRLSSDWDVAVVDPSTTHLYQPGLVEVGGRRIHDRDVPVV